MKENNGFVDYGRDIDFIFEQAMATKYIHYSYKSEQFVNENIHDIALHSVNVQRSFYV